MPNYTLRPEEPLLNIPQKTFIDSVAQRRRLVNEPQQNMLLRKQKNRLILNENEPLPPALSSPAASNEENEPLPPSVSSPAAKEKNKFAVEENEPTEVALKEGEKAISEIAYLESLPYNKWPLSVPMPFFPLDLHGLGHDEFRNAGSSLMDSLYQRGREIFENNLELFDWDKETDKLPNPEDCIGVIFTLTDGPVLFEKSTKSDIPGIDPYHVIVSDLTNSYEPIYILTKERACPVSAEKYLELYKDFIPPISLDEEEPRKKNNKN